jgi:hypothetical protein
MNEEILKNAKFFLFQYSERIAEQMALISENMENNRRIFAKRNSGADWYGKELLKRIDLQEGKLLVRKKQLKQLDECIKYLSTLIK